MLSNRRAAHAALAMLLCAAAPAPQDPARWDVSEAVVPLTGAASVSGALSSTAPLLNMIGSPQKAMLVLRCSERQLAVYVAWPQVLAVSGTAFMSTQTQTMVLWRLDAAPIAVNFWDRSDDGTAAGKFTTKGAQKLIAQVAAARQLVVRMTGQTTQDAVFDLREIGPIAAKAENACGVATNTAGGTP